MKKNGNKIFQELKKLVINILKFIYEKLAIILNISFVILIFVIKDNGCLFCSFFIFEFAKWCKNVIEIEKEKDKFAKIKIGKRFTHVDEEGNIVVKKNNMEKAIMFLYSVEEYLYNE